jgi:hypothetical protein
VKGREFTIRKILISSLRKMRDLLENKSQEQKATDIALDELIKQAKEYE